MTTPTLPNNTLQPLVTEVKGIIDSARSQAVRSVDFARVQMYWNIGRRIVEEEQHGAERAKYGAYIIKNLAEALVPEYGSGFSERQLKYCRKFYNTYPIGNAIKPNSLQVANKVLRQHHFYKNKSVIL